MQTTANIYDIKNTTRCVRLFHLENAGQTLCIYNETYIYEYIYIYCNVVVFCDDRAVVVLT